MKKISLTALCIVLPALGLAAADGPKLYEKFCLKCHGAQGKGDGKSAKLFDPRPNDFTQAKWQSKVTDAQIFDAVKLGTKASTIKVGKKMPAFDKKMNDEEIKATVAVVRGFGGAKK